ncbi:helix-turn-helix domain-containing protein [Serratia ficaria]|uniref:helix-turn-helix domain-containing protein n=1 Tax=Serratia ficaria TaxID=61651 RepID=UPI0021B828CC|nr:helix-turn-helix transcriptional regulator [Serratia ficaria]
MNTLHERLREERNRIGMNQTEFGALAGVGKTTQINYENGSRSPSADYLAAIFKYSVDIQYVVTGVKGGVVREREPIDGGLFLKIVTTLEKVATRSKRKWPSEDLAATAVKVYNFLIKEEIVDSDKIERLLKLVVNN